jgi:hypothetical protein
MVRAAAAAAAAAAREVIDDVCFTGPRCACAASTFANRFPVLFFKVVAVHCAISANLWWDGRLWREGA